jgi:hypothetical protein
MRKRKRKEMEVDNDPKTEKKNMSSGQVRTVERILSLP